MPHLIALAVAGAGLWAGYRWLSRETIRFRDTLHQADDDARQRAQATTDTASATENLTRATPSEMKDLPSLERDPQTGVYRPRRQN